MAIVSLQFDCMNIVYTNNLLIKNFSLELTLNEFNQSRLRFLFLFSLKMRIFSMVSICLIIYDAVYLTKLINYSVFNHFIQRKISFKIKHYDFCEMCPLHTSISSYVFFSSNWFSLAVS